MLGEIWECSGEENREKKKSLYSEGKEDHEWVVEELFYEEIKCRVKYIDR